MENEENLNVEQNNVNLQNTKKVKNKKPLLAIVLIALIGIIGGTIAVFTSTSTIPKIFKTLTYKTQTEETFTSPSDWKPGVTTTKKVLVRNTGQVDVAVRVSYTQTWVSSTHKSLALKKDNKDVAVINRTNTGNWIEKVENGTTYYYYKNKLAPNGVTTAFIDSVKFNDQITYDIPCTTVGTTTTCASNGDGYDGATYTLTLKIETVQFDAYRTFWNTTATIA